MPTGVSIYFREETSPKAAPWQLRDINRDKNDLGTRVFPLASCLETRRHAKHRYHRTTYQNPNPKATSYGNNNDDAMTTTTTAITSTSTAVTKPPSR